MCAFLLYAMCLYCSIITFLCELSLNVKKEKSMNYSQTFFSRQFLWEIVRIVTVGVASLLFYLHVIPLPALLAAMAFGLYSLVKTAAIDLVKERKIGTELFITI